jgi:hypothetical protein
MPPQELYDNEDWYDDPDADDDPEDDESPPCPECGEPVSAITGKCPNCGYWLTAADRQAMWTGEGKPAWLKVTAFVLLVVILLSIAVGVF